MPAVFAFSLPSSNDQNTSMLQLDACLCTGWVDAGGGNEDRATAGGG